VIKNGYEFKSKFIKIKNFIFKTVLKKGPNYNLTWANRPSDISEDNWVTLQRLYQNVDDIELFMGGIAENPVEGKAKLWIKCFST